MNMKTTETPVPKSINAIRSEYGVRYFNDFEDLPFVKHEGEYENHSNWSVPPSDDYLETCEIGYYYGACYLQYMRSDPGSIGSNVLGAIVKDIDFTDNTSAKGYHVGFFSFIETFACFGEENSDMWATFDQKTKLNRELDAQWKAEEEQGKAV